MTGGLIQIAAKGIADLYLIGDPEITLFKIVYRRHTNFSKSESIIRFNSNLTFGKSDNVKLKRNGDLVNKMYLVSELPAIQAVYRQLTVSIMNSILNPVEIYHRFPQDYTNDTIITTDYYVENIIPDIQSSIQLYNDLIVLINKEIASIQLLINDSGLDINSVVTKYSYNENINKSKYATQNVTSQTLPNIYYIYQKIFEVQAPGNELVTTVSQLYNFFINLYNTIDGTKINLENIITFKNKLYLLAHDKLYYSQALNIKLTIGFNGLDAYIIKNGLTQPNYIGHNYALYDSFNTNSKNVVLLENSTPQTIKTQLEQLIVANGIDVDIIKNLDLYLTYLLYISSVPDEQITMITFPRIINSLNTIFLKTLPNNISQFLTILGNIRTFTQNNRFDNPTQNFLLFGVFRYLNNNKYNLTYSDENDCNILCYDTNLTNKKSGEYYPNLIKSLIDKFILDSIDIFEGSVNTFDTQNNTNKFLPYYDKKSFSYLTLSNNQNPYSLYNILQNGYQFTNTDPIDNIWFLEFMPIVTMENLFDMFEIDSTNNIYGSFWNSSFISTEIIDDVNRTKYLDFIMSIYLNDNTYQLDSNTINYLTSKTENISTTEFITANVLSPFNLYNKTELYNIIGVDAIVYEPYFKSIYKPIESLNIGLTTTYDIPTILTRYDVLIMMICYDVLKVIDASTSSETNKIFLKEYVCRVFHLYVLYYDEIPTYDTANMSPSYYYFSPQIFQYIKPNLFNTSSATGKYNNDIARISSIYNYSERNKIYLYNNLYSSNLLSTEYYRLLIQNENPSELENINQNTPINTSECQAYGVGYTMQQVYEIFVSFFFNQRLGVDSIQTIPLENVLFNTNFYDISDIDPNDYILTTENYITNNFVLNINTVVTYISQYHQILEIKNIAVNPSLFYFNTTYNIMSFGVNIINYTYTDPIVTDNSILNITGQNLNPLTVSGYLGQILGNQIISTLPPEFISEFIGECYKSLNLVPLPNGYETSDNFYFTSMNTELPRLNTTSQTVNRTLLDLLHNFRFSLTNDQAIDPSVVDLYDFITNIINDQEFILNFYPRYRIVKNFNDIPSRQRTQIFIDNVQYQPNMDDGIYYSFNNNQGNVFAKNNQNPNGYNMSDVATTYKSFSDVYIVIQYVLDLIIFYSIYQGLIIDLTGTNNTSNETTTYTQYINYLTSLKVKYTSYLAQLTIDGTIYERSLISNRINRLLWDNGGYKPAEFAWARYLGYSLIEDISVTIGGQLIDRHNYDWMYLEYVTERNLSQERGHDIIIGNIPELYTFNNQMKIPHVLYIPLKFWFCKSPTSSLPLVCTAYTDVVINIKLRNLNEVAFWYEKDVIFLQDPQLKCHLLADYIYMDFDERKKYVIAKHEYLIETVKYESILYNKSMLSGSMLIHEAILTNICKYLLWSVKIIDLTNKSEEYQRDRILNWMDNTYIIDKNAVSAFDIRFDQRERESLKYASYYNLVQPYEKLVSSLPENVFLYSFALFPKLLQPSGGVNVDMLNFLTIDMMLSKDTLARLQNDEIRIEWKVYGKLYNLLRIMSGMAGLTFFGRK